MRHSQNGYGIRHIDDDQFFDYVKTLEKLRHNLKEIFDNQKKALGIYQKEQLIGDCSERLAKIIKKAIASRQTKICLVIEQDHKTLDIRLFPVFGVCSGWFCYCVSWPTGGYISAAFRTSLGDRK